MLEEASSIRGGNIQATVAPMLGVDKTVLFCISTPGYGDNMYNKMALMKDTNGAPLFQLEMVNQACNNCQRVGRAALCRHLDILLPAWKDPKAGELQRLMMDSLIYETETLGLLMGNSTGVFARPLVDYWLDHQHAVFDDPRGPRFIFVALDPSRGSDKTSQLCLVAGVRTQRSGFMVTFLLCLFLRGSRIGVMP